MRKELKGDNEISTSLVIALANLSFCWGLMHSSASNSSFMF